MVIWCVALGDLYLWRFSIQGNIWPVTHQPPESWKSSVQAPKTDTLWTVSVGHFWSYYLFHRFYDNTNVFCCVGRYDLMLACWQWDPTKRPTFSQIRSQLDVTFGKDTKHLSWSYISESKLLFFVWSTKRKNIKLQKQRQATLWLPVMKNREKMMELHLRAKCLQLEQWTCQCVATGWRWNNCLLTSKETCPQHG